MLDIIKLFSLPVLSSFRIGPLFLFQTLPVFCMRLKIETPSPLPNGASLLHQMFSLLSIYH